ncbi:MAG: hypothetical protein Q4B47_01490 [Eubacteriales bacterium]|nr:hypothetical protein [Eubacteriales bacterium]
MKEYKVTLNNLTDAAAFVEQVEKYDIQGSIQYKDREVPSISLISIIASNIIGRKFVFRIDDTTEKENIDSWKKSVQKLSFL